MKEPLILEAICAELDIKVFDNSDSAVVIRVEKLALGVVNEPEILEAICAELDIKVFDNSDSALVTLVEKLELAAVNEPEILEAICAELDNAPMKIPEKSLPIILALELILPLAVTWVLAELPNRIEFLLASIKTALLSPADSILKSTSAPASLKVVSLTVSCVKSTIFTPPTVMFTSSSVNKILVSASPVCASLPATFISPVVSIEPNEPVPLAITCPLALIFALAVISFPTNILFVVVISVGALPVINNEPVNWCVSSDGVSPDIVEPLLNDEVICVTDELTI